MSIRVAVLNGPNLNLLGTREPEHYGTATLQDIEERLAAVAADHGAELEFFQTNDEGALVDYVQERGPTVAGWLVNAAAFTHTSVALRDALQASGRPFVEVHLSNVYAREPFRRTSLLADLAIGVIAGFRVDSYVFGLTALIDRLRASE